jgi:hypothetical protein
MFRKKILSPSAGLTEDVHSKCWNLYLQVIATQKTNTDKKTCGPQLRHDWTPNPIRVTSLVVKNVVTIPTLQCCGSEESYATLHSVMLKWLKQEVRFLRYVPIIGKTRSSYYFFCLKNKYKEPTWWTATWVILYKFGNVRIA